MKLSVEQILQQGIEAHKDGQVQEAERLYRSILQVQTNHPEANHHLGVLAVGVGNPELALPHFKIALETNFEQGQYWLSMIGALITVGQIDNARKVLQQGREIGLKGEKVDQLAKQLEPEEVPPVSPDPAGAPQQEQVNALISLYNQGQLEEVVKQTSILVERFPQEIMLFNLLGAANIGLHRLDDAIASYDRALQIKPDYAEAHNNLGIALKENGDLTAATESYNRALQIKPDYAEAHNNLGNALQEKGDLTDAIESFSRALQSRPDYAEAHSNLGNALKENGDLTAAIESYNRALQIKPDHAEAHFNLGHALKEDGDLTASIESYNRALQIKPDHAEAHFNLGNALKEDGDLTASIECYNRALQIEPDHAEAHFNLGHALKENGDLTAAIESYNLALQSKPDFAEAHFNLGNSLKEKGDLRAAIESYNRALQIKPDFAEAHNNLGIALKDSGDPTAAIESCNRAIQIKPDYAEAHLNLSAALQENGDLTAAIESYNRTLQLKPDYVAALSQRLYQQARIGDWDAVEADRDLIPGLGVTTGFVSPFTLLPLEDHPARHLKRSELYAKNKFKVTALPAIARPSLKPERLRIGYFSADFHNHATMYLMAKLFKLHDKSRLIIHAYSYGRTIDEMSARLQGAVDVFHDAQNLSDSAVAELARSEQFDIAIDLKGYTRNTRSGIFAYRAAPIQVNYLGYPGTMGAPFIDYIVADKFLIPTESQKFYSEKIAYLPHNYQVNDDTRPIAESYPSKNECDLPEKGVVFCCFNNNYKISSREFDIWMRLLTKLPESVLWLLKSNMWSDVSLKNKARDRGVDSSRLIFAERLPMNEHLARHRHADIFLDTFNINAHTTASDALWVGIPVVTKSGAGFAARVAGSLLTALELPDLVAANENDYEQLALDLAANPPKLQAVKARLSTNRDNAPLFDTARFTKNIETAYTQMYDQYFNGKEPKHLFVNDDETH